MWLWVLIGTYLFFTDKEIKKERYFIDDFKDLKLIGKLFTILLYILIIFLFPGVKIIKFIENKIND